MAENGVIPKDYFSARSALYAAARPGYPPELFAALAALPARRQLALDCGTGNGQAAVGLARHFVQVVATDGSPEQLRHALPAPNVDYRCAPAESSGLAAGSVDLVTAAQALHWFDIPAFFREAERVLTPGGAIAVWGYGDPWLEDPALQAILHGYNRGTVEAYWPAERHLLLDGYRTVEFPFEEVDLPELQLEQHWTLRQLSDLISTWSATVRYSARHGVDPVPPVEKALAAHWGNPEQPRVIRWPLYVRAGRTAR